MGQPDAAGWFGVVISGHQRTFVELRRLPRACFEHVAQHFHGASSTAATVPSPEAAASRNMMTIW
jgi:hypothetical protein